MPVAWVIESDEVSLRQRPAFCFSGVDHAAAMKEVAYMCALTTVFRCEQYVQLLRERITTNWVLKACGDNCGKCATGDADSAAVKAVVGRPGLPGPRALAELPALELVQAASWMYTTPTEVPLRAAIANADTYPDCGAISPNAPNCVLSLESLSEFCIAGIFEWLYSMRVRSAAMLDCAWSADAPSRCVSAWVRRRSSRIWSLSALEILRDG